jgi:hypothetical protein
MIDWEKVDDAGVAGLYGKAKPNKYRAKRTEYNGILYDSKAEAEEAAMLDLDIRKGSVAWWLRQVWIPLGPDFRTRVDFLVGHRHASIRSVVHVYAKEVKGIETREFKRIRQLWPKYAPFMLQIVKAGKPTETILGYMGMREGNP